MVYEKTFTAFLVVSGFVSAFAGVVNLCKLAFSNSATGIDHADTASAFAVG